jgi:hypothetical protein
MTATPSPTSPMSPRLLDRLADALRSHGDVAALRQAYLDRARGSIRFHSLRH